MSLELASPILTAMARILVGLVLLIAGTSKLRTGENQFLKDILAYELLPRRASCLLARWLPWVEAFTGGLLVVGLFAQLAATLEPYQ